MPDDWEEAGFGLYIHWPFCQAKCPYCDFNSHVVREIDHARWKRAYLSEIARLGRETGPRVLRSVFFGGGTPSMMEPDLVADILSAVHATWPCANDLEVTLEANPTSVEAGRFRGYRDGGVNRVSLGVQALNDDDLRRLGRLHSAKEAMTAFDLARDSFERVSFDLIYARQDQTLAEWESELRQAVSLAVDHLSLYQLTIEEGTAFGDRFAAGGLRGLPDEDTGADLYAATQQICGEAGLSAYEVSNHARPGSESRHNVIYWQSGDWAAIGPGAHGRLTLGGVRFATEALRAPMPWLQAVEQAGSGDTLREPLDADAGQTELVLMGLRMTDGIDQTRVRNPLFLNNINGLIDRSVIEQKNGRFMVTEDYRSVLNAVLAEVLRD